MKNLFAILMVLAFSITDLKAQIYRNKPGNFFGVQIKPLIPMGIVGEKAFEMSDNGFESTVSPILGYSYGAIVRVGITDLLALETGLNYNRKNYKVNYRVPNLDVYAHDEVGLVSFDIPLSFLVYIKLGKQLFMNVSIGVSGNYNPSNIQSRINPEGKHLFVFEGKRYHYFDFSMLTELGFEYRTLSSGTIYLGLSGQIPFSPTMQIATAYQYGTNKTVTKADVEGSTFALALKYFFHNQTKKKGIQFNKGPIEQ